VERTIDPSALRRDVVRRCMTAPRPVHHRGRKRTRTDAVPAYSSPFSTSTTRLTCTDVRGEEPPRLQPRNSGWQSTPSTSAGSAQVGTSLPPCARPVMTAATA